MKKIIKNIKYKISRIEYNYFLKCKNRGLTYKFICNQALKLSWLAFYLVMIIIMCLILIVVLAVN